MKLSLIIHDIRSTHNVGSLLRTAECLGLEHVYITGYTPYPEHEKDTRLPHISRKLTGQIRKTSLGTEDQINWTHHESINELIVALKKSGTTVVGLEQTPTSVLINDSLLQERFATIDHLAVIIGREVEGIDESVLSLCDDFIEIPMKGQKESFNVSVASAIALYVLSEL